MMENLPISEVDETREITCRMDIDPRSSCSNVLLRESVIYTSACGLNSFTRLFTPAPRSSYFMGLKHGSQPRAATKVLLATFRAC